MLIVNDLVEFEYFLIDPMIRDNRKRFMMICDLSARSMLTRVDRRVYSSLGGKIFFFFFF